MGSTISSGRGGSTPPRGMRNSFDGFYSIVYGRGLKYSEQCLWHFTIYSFISLFSMYYNLRLLWYYIVHTVHCSTGKSLTVAVSPDLLALFHELNWTHPDKLKAKMVFLNYSFSQLCINPFFAEHFCRKLAELHWKKSWNSLKIE